MWVGNAEYAVIHYSTSLSNQSCRRWPGSKSVASHCSLHTLPEEVCSKTCTLSPQCPLLTQLSDVKYTGKWPERIGGRRLWWHVEVLAVGQSALNRLKPEPTGHWKDVSKWSFHFLSKRTRERLSKASVAG